MTTASDRGDLERARGIAVALEQENAVLRQVVGVHIAASHELHAGASAPAAATALAEALMNAGLDLDPEITAWHESHLTGGTR